jgi:hypothetical protein
MAHDDEEDVDMTVKTVVAATESALLCRFDTGDEVWVPRAYCGSLGKVGEDGDISLPYWLAAKEGLV